MKQLFCLLIFICQFAYAQENNILERLQALDNNGKIWFNIDGYSITSEEFKFNFDEKGIKKVLNKHGIKNDSRVKDENIKFNNYYFLETNKLTDNITQYNSYYIVENQNKKISAIWFAKTGKTDKETEVLLTNMILENKIPKENFATMEIGTINFGGRKIDLGSSCYWTFLNTVQCPYFGEMNWSVHRDLQDAKNAIENQLALTKSKKAGKVIAEELVDIEFEDTPTVAKKVTYEITGITGALTGLSGGKTLTIYYVAEKIRGNYMSCVLSFWNNDQINPETQLPPLLEKVMKLK